MKITYYSSGTPNDFPSVPAPPVFSSLLFHSFSPFVNASYPSFLHLRSKKKILRKINVILAKRNSIENQALQVRIKVTQDHRTKTIDILLEPPLLEFQCPRKRKMHHVRNERGTLTRPGILTVAIIKTIP